MKKKAAAIFAALILLAGCASEKNDGENSSSAASETAEVIERAPTEETEPELIPFSQYSFELRGTDGNYIMTIGRGEFGDEISVTIEDNTYQSKDFVITAPAGYEPDFPFDQMSASYVVRVIKNDIDDTYIPDILQFRFNISAEALDADPENAVYSVCRFYTADKGELREIKATELTNDGEKRVYDYLEMRELYHTEPDKFICSMDVDDMEIFYDDGSRRPIEKRVSLKTMKLDCENMEFVMGYEELTEDNPLYFGYAYWAAANCAARYFKATTFNISDFEHYIEMPSGTDANTSEYYFKIDDSRFKCKADLVEYLETIFSESTAERIMKEAPQKYCDIDGELYGIAGDGGYDFTLGTLTFSDMEISENRMIFRSRQEKFDEMGRFTGYTDGGDFVISKQDDGYWKVVQYRYPSF